MADSTNVFSNINFVFVDKHNLFDVNLLLLLSMMKLFSFDFLLSKPKKWSCGTKTKILNS